MDTNDTISDRVVAAARQIIEGSGIDLMDAAILAMELLRECKGRGNSLKRARQGIRLGAEALRKRGKVVSFEYAVEETIKAKAYRRIRTIRDVKYTMKKLMKECPDIRKRHLRSITSNDCVNYLQRAFSTNRQRYKGRVILSGIFSFSCKRGWCEENPVIKVDSPPIFENEIHCLHIEEVEKLLKCSLIPEFSSCSPGLGVMLYAGVRPTEASRLRWGDINMKEKIITIMPIHSKTGGMRHITIHPVLEKWLRLFSSTKQPEEKLCLSSWPFVWKELRQHAGWGTKKGLIPWPQDCLRHSFASYHAKHFRNFFELQIEMGHRSSSLLRTRYLNMRGVSKENAERFWKGVL